MSLSWSKTRFWQDCIYGTWQMIFVIDQSRAAPAGVFFGWKDFYAKDHPMMNAPQTMTRTPLLSMISYQ